VILPAPPQRREAVNYPSEKVKRCSSATMGVPIFQEQGCRWPSLRPVFQPGEEGRLRRAWAAWKRRGGWRPFQRQLIEGHAERGYYRELRAIRDSIRIIGFGEYGFPECGVGETRVVDGRYWKVFDHR